MDRQRKRAGRGAAALASWVGDRLARESAQGCRRQSRNLGLWHRARPRQASPGSARSSRTSVELRACVRQCSSCCQVCPSNEGRIIGGETDVMIFSARLHLPVRGGRGLHGVLSFAF